MELTNAQILEVVPALNELAGKELPIQTAMKIRRNLRHARPIAADVQAEQMKLVSAYGQRDDEGRLVQSAPGVYPWQRERVREANAKQDELLNLSCNGFEPLVVEELGNVSVKAETLMGLGDLLVDEQESN